MTIYAEILVNRLNEVRAEKSAVEKEKDLNKKFWPRIYSEAHFDNTLDYRVKDLPDELKGLGQLYNRFFLIDNQYPVSDFYKKVERSLGKIDSPSNFIDFLIICTKYAFFEVQATLKDIYNIKKGKIDPAKNSSGRPKPSSKPKKPSSDSFLPPKDKFDPPSDGFKPPTEYKP